MLIIKRDSGYADSLRNYKVIVDDQEIGEIANGEKKSFNLSQGNHIIYIKLDYGRSNKISFKYKNKETVEFDCRSSLRGRRFILLPLYTTFLKNKYITLSRVG